jgi:threonine dehydratase
MTVSITDIREARQRIDPVINHTPMVFDEKLSVVLDAASYLKAECLQRGGSFKMRGAYNKIAQLTDDEKSRGVCTASAGNHAQGVALAARLQGIKATIVLPEFAPLTKVVATRELGAEVILKGDSFDAAVAYSLGLAQEQGLAYVHAFDDEKIIAGQGSIGMEIAESQPDTTIIVVPIGGGGIISGVAIAAKAMLPGVRVIGVQAENVSAVKKSLRAGEPLEAIAKPTIADGIAVKRPGVLTLPIIKEFVDDVVEVTEEELAAAIFHCVTNAHIVAEGAGSAGVAALLAGKVRVRSDDTVCAVLAGGNIDGNLLSRVIEQVLVRQGRYIILKLLVIDRPGMLAKMLNEVAAAEANVVEIQHQRAIWLAPLGYTGVEMILEVRDKAHARAVHDHLESCGYNVIHQGQGNWEE